MAYNSIWCLVLSLMVFLIVIILCMKDNQKELITSEDGNLKEIQDEKLEENVQELDPRNSFNYIIARYFEKDYKEGFFMIYKRLLDKVSDISTDPRCNSDDFEYYSDLTSDYFSFCAKCEAFTLDLFDYTHYGFIDTSKLQAIKNLDADSVKLEMNRAKKALNSKVANRIFHHFDLETVLKSVAYYSFACPAEDEYTKVRELSKKLCKYEKADFLICDIYMEYRKGNSEQINETVRKLMEDETVGLNGITIEGMFCLASALHWMGEKEGEERLLSSRYKKKTIY